jgi:hypothetical protein
MVTVRFEGKQYVLTGEQYKEWKAAAQINDQDDRADAKRKLLIRWGIYE